MSNPYEFLTRLPEAGVTAPFEKHPGVFIRGAFVEGPGHSVVIEKIDGPKVPAPVYTLNIAGRGALTFDEQTFRDIVSSAVAMFEITAPGYKAPVVEPSARPVPATPSFLSGADTN
jgi:hypothetical protein